MKTQKACHPYGDACFLCFVDQSNYLKSYKEKSIIFVEMFRQIHIIPVRTEDHYGKQINQIR